MPPAPSFPGSDDPIIVRNATLDDVPAIARLTNRVYEAAQTEGYQRGMIGSQVRRFPEGQFVVVHEETIIGYCATFRIAEKLALAPHTWVEITGNGYASRHDPEGNWLYGMEICVDPDYRGFRIGQRLYQERRKLCQELRLTGIVFAGRIPSLRRRWKDVGSADDYVQGVKERRYRDPVLNFQLSNGFEVVGILDGYDPTDYQSMGYAVHMAWRNPKVRPDEPAVPSRPASTPRRQDSVRVCAVQYQQRRVDSFEEFLHLVEYYVDVAADYKSDFVVFPELFSLQLLSMADSELSPKESIEALTDYTPGLRDALREMAIRYNINIIGGSHPTRMPNGRTENICYVCLRDGRVEIQPKIHPTPNEVYWWNIEGADELNAIETDCGPIGVLICYDSEFPELGRYLADQGANILFVPYCTDERQGHMRVRYCCHARAVENQIYVVMAGNVGNLPRVANMDIQYAQSCVLTPCDFPFARDGIAADSTPNAEMVILADLRLDTLREARQHGTVQNFKDRRHDLYRTQWLR